MILGPGGKGHLPITAGIFFGTQKEMELGPSREEGSQKSVWVGRSFFFFKKKEACLGLGPVPILKREHAVERTLIATLRSLHSKQDVDGMLQACTSLRTRSWMGSIHKMCHSKIYQETTQFIVLEKCSKWKTHF